MADLDELLDVGQQRALGAAEHVPSESRCIRCSRVATVGSWCQWCHPSRPVGPPAALLAPEVVDRLVRQFIGERGW